MKAKEAMEALPEYFQGLLQSSSAQRPAWNMEMIRSGASNVWSYVDACMIAAALALYEINGDRRYLTFADEFLDWYVESDGSIRTYYMGEWNIDNICPGKNLFPLLQYTGKEKYQKAIFLLQKQLEQMPRTKEGSFWHKGIYPWQVWLDGLFMAQPFYMKYEMEYGDGQGWKDILLQFSNVQRLMKKENGLYFHGYDESRSMYWADPKTGCSPNCWGRAVGWLMAALADVLEASGPDKSKELNDFLGRMALELVQALAPWQQEDGMFLQVLDMPEAKGNYPETSATMLIAYGILKCIRLGYLPAEYRRMAQRAFEGTVQRYLTRQVDGSLKLGGICLVAGLGGAAHRDGSLKYYFGEPVVENEGKGIAPLMLCYTELIR